MPQPRPRTTVPSLRTRRDGRPVGRRGPVAALLVVALLLALVGGLGGTLATAEPAAAAGSCSGPIAAGQIRVVLVVDPGETGPRGPMATCLVVQAGTAGSKILAQRASELGLPAPRYAGSGLLCGLDGFPASGCPVNNGGTYAYWAYFNGAGGSWSYGHDNPFVRRMVDGEIMGWRYTTGSADGQSPAPRIAPGSSLFPPLAPPPTEPPPVAPTQPAGPPAIGGGGGTSGAPDPTGTVPGATDGATTVAPDGTTTDPGATGDGTAATTADGSTTSADGSTSSDDERADGEELAADPASSSGSDAGRFVGLVVALVLILVLVGGAVVMTTLRRSRTVP